MKKLLIKLKEWLVNFILAFFSLFFNKTKMEKKEESTINKNSQKQNIPKQKITEEDSNPNSEKNLFKEHLQFRQRKPLSDEEVIEEIYKTIEKIYQIKRSNLSYEKKEQLKKYVEKINKKIKPSIKNLNTKEELQNILEAQVKKEQEEKIENYPILTEMKELKKEVEKIEDEIIENKGIKKRIQNRRIATTLDRKETPPTTKINLNQGKNQQSNTLSSNEIAPLFIVENISKPEFEQTNKERKSIEEEIKEISIEKEKEPQRESKIDKKETVNLEKKEKTFIFINFAQLERENNVLIKKAKKETEKEDLIDKEYEKIENLLDEKIKHVEDLLKEKITPEQKEKIQSELNKMKSTKEKIILYKDQDLEDLRISLEESIPPEEIKEVVKKLQELSENEKLEQMKIEIMQLEKRTVKEIEEYKMWQIKEQCKKTLYRLEIPLFLSFPFIKNKHFRRFIKGLFVFQSFFFIKNLLFGSKYKEEMLNLTTIKRGRDALQESLSITTKNKETFEKLKISILQKYPQLQNDLEFMNTLEILEIKLDNEYEKLIKQEKVVNKYFDKSQTLIRKRKR